jgi:hypothetical protein
MKFYTETIQGDLILIKTNIETPPPCPVIARSVVTPKQSPTLLIRFVLWFLGLVGPLPTLVPPLTKVRFAVLIIIGMAVVTATVEVLAQNHIERSLGLVT